jgi:hypothetical protein
VNIEAAILFLRALAGVSLLAFLFLLFTIIWRSLRQVECQLEASRTQHGYLTRQSQDRPGAVNERFPLRAITSLGRSAGNSVVVNDDFASGEHARIILEDGQWWLEDRGSKNGTSLNLAAINRRTKLADGDVIGIGKVSFQLTLASKIDASAL